MPERGLSTAEFRKRLAAWFSRAARDLPWRRGADPYQTWISEIMLQQTRVDQALPYYERFVQAYPDVDSLADADLDEVLLNWEGLGYYSRARNLHKAARLIVAEHGGTFPDTYDGLRSLPGIGDYTASAVGSLAFGLPEAVLDGNVIRVLARYDALSDDVGKLAVRKQLRERAQELLDASRPGTHNEAMMELGATVCTPKAPACTVCPVATGCLGRQTPEAFPVKKKKAPVPTVTVAIAVIENPEGQLLIQRRPEAGLLGGLWEFPGGKCEQEESPQDAVVREVQEELGILVRVTGARPMIRHAYSHFKVQIHPFDCHLVSGVPATRNGEPWLWVHRASLSDYAFPRANRRLIESLTET